MFSENKFKKIQFGNSDGTCSSLPYLCRISCAIFEKGVSCILAQIPLGPPLNLRGTLREVIGPEVVLGTSDQFDECDEKTPRMRTESDQTLEQNTSDLKM